MRFYAYRPDLAKELYEELSAAPGPWPDETDDVKPEYFNRAFNTAGLKFPNGALNYSNFYGMIGHQKRTPYWNPAYPKSKVFLEEKFREVSGETGLVGRCVFWKVPPHGGVLEHFDAYMYHHLVIRYVIFLNDHPEGTLEVRCNDELLSSKMGDIHKFFPAMEKHSFVSKSDNPWYFLAFDYFDSSRLSHFEDSDKEIAALNDPKFRPFINYHNLIDKVEGLENDFHFPRIIGPLDNPIPGDERKYIKWKKTLA